MAHHVLVESSFVLSIKAGKAKVIDLEVRTQISIETARQGVVAMYAVAPAERITEERNPNGLAALDRQILTTETEVIYLVADTQRRLVEVAAWI